jgi:hypothetical protein
LSVKDLAAIVLERLPTLCSRPIPSPLAQIANGAIARAKSRKCVEVKGAAVTVGDLSKDVVKDLLIQFRTSPDSLPQKDVAHLRKRSLIAPVTTKWFSLTKGASWVPSKSRVRPRIVELTEDLMKTGNWERRFQSAQF